MKNLTNNQLTFKTSIKRIEEDLPKVFKSEISKESLEKEYRHIIDPEELVFLQAKQILLTELDHFIFQNKTAKILKKFLSDLSLCIRNIQEEVTYTQTLDNIFETSTSFHGLKISLVEMKCEEMYHKYIYKEDVKRIIPTSLFPDYFQEECQTYLYPQGLGFQIKDNKLKVFLIAK